MTAATPRGLLPFLFLSLFLAGCDAVATDIYLIPSEATCTGNVTTGNALIYGEEAGSLSSLSGNGYVFSFGNGDIADYGPALGYDASITQISLSCNIYNNVGSPTNATIAIGINRSSTPTDCKVTLWDDSSTPDPIGNYSTCDIAVAANDHINFKVIESGGSIGGCVASARIEYVINANSCTVINYNITNNITTVINETVSNQTIIDVIAAEDTYLLNTGDTGDGNYIFTGFSRSDGASLESGILAGGYYVPLDGDITSSILGAYYILHKALDRHTITSTGLKNTGRGFKLGESNFVQLDGTTQNPSLNITLDLNTFTTPFIYGPYTFLLTFKTGQILPDSITLQGVRQTDGSIYTIFTDTSPTYLSGPSSDPTKGKYYVSAGSIGYGNRMTGVNLLLSYTGTVNNDAAFDEYFLYMPYAAEMTYSLIQQGGPLNMNFDGGNDFNATFHNIRVDGCVIYNGGTLGTCV